MADLARSRSRVEFGRLVECPLLLVPLGDPRSELAVTLDQSARLASVRVEPTSGFVTSELHLTDVRAWRVRAPLSADHLRGCLARDAHFAIRLEKRAEAARSFTTRITVGRTRNCDIVLREPSVSKFHAWFERDDNDVFYVADAGSSNGTRLNGALLTRHARTLVSPGDDLMFGNVQATVCPAEVLWQALLPGAG
jgi:hypothetical protein